MHTELLGKIVRITGCMEILVRSIVDHLISSSVATQTIQAMELVHKSYYTRSRKPWEWKNLISSIATLYVKSLIFNKSYETCKDSR